MNIFLVEIVIQQVPNTTVLRIHLQLSRMNGVSFRVILQLVEVEVLAKFHIHVIHCHDYSFIPHQTKAVPFYFLVLSRARVESFSPYIVVFNGGN